MGRARVAALAVVLLLGAGSVAEAATTPRVTVSRSAHGIPHIKSTSWRGLGYGYGWAFAQDNLCVIADSYVTVSAQRSRFFGPDASWSFRGNGTTVNNLNSDFFFQRIIDRRVVEDLAAKPPPLGPRPEIRAGVRGYVQGYNRYLRRAEGGEASADDEAGGRGREPRRGEADGVDKLPDPACRGEAWVRPITEIDVYRRFYQLALLASSGVAIDGIGGAQPPAGGGDQAERDAAATARARVELGRIPARRFDELLGGIGSNAYGLGRAATDNGRGMVLGNRGQLPLPQPLLRDQPGPIGRHARRDPASLPGHPVGQHDRGRRRG